MITERDINILRFINDFGFAKIKMIDAMFFKKDRSSAKIEAARMRLSLLENHNYLKSIRDFSNKEKIFQLTDEGRSFLSSIGLSVFEKTKFNWPSFHHDCKVIDVYLHFRHYGLARAISERSGRVQEIFSNNAPDLILLDNNDQYICVEVELTQKSKSRLIEKLHKMLNYKNVSSIFYLCQSPQIMQAIQSAIEEVTGKKGNNRLQLLLLDDFFMSDSLKQLF